MISLIVIYDENKAIGFENKLLAHIPEDLAYFKKTTIGHPIIMGRKTYESIGRPLPGRKNIVISRKRMHIPGVEVHSVDAILELYKESLDEVFVCGGSQIYRQFLPHAKKLYITKLSGTYPADTYFPEWNVSEFDCISTTVLSNDATAYVYERKD